MTDFDFISLILGLGSIAVGTAGPAIKFVKNEIAEKKQTPQPQIQPQTQQQAPAQVAAQTAHVSASVEPKIVYSTKPVVEKKKMDAVSPISFVGNISVPIP